MGTRGCYGFYKNGESKLTYNNFDSYPSVLGKHVLDFIKRHDEEYLNKIFDLIQLVKGSSYPTEEQIKTLDKLGYSAIYHSERLKWSEILGSFEGDLKVYEEDELPFMIDSNDFIKDSLYCEWAYIINLDTNEFEVYEGFQKEPNDNRYSIDMPKSGKYYSCKLIKSIPFNEARSIVSLDDLIE